MLTVVIAFAILILGFGALGMWEWVWLSLGFAVALSLAEIWAVRRKGLTITDLFRREIRLNRDKAIVATLLLIAAFAIILAHLWGILP